MSIENEQNKSGPVGRSLLPPGVADISINQMPAKAMNNCWQSRQVIFKNVSFTFISIVYI